MNERPANNGGWPDDAILADLEETAGELADLAGTEIMTALGRTLSVRYKGSRPGSAAFKDPVSEVDHQVEVLLRQRLGERFPDHGVIGEEMEAQAGQDSDFVWVVDPIDGTTNFVNGLPLFAASIGVLHRGRPVVGALWCSTSHACRAGVYRARRGGRLRFENEPIEILDRGMVRRRRAGEPVASADEHFPFDIRKTGSASLECAFVAAGLLQVARFSTPNVWDVAGGIALVRATGGRALARGEDGWIDLERFEPMVRGEGRPDLKFWSRPMILGEPSAVERIKELNA